MLAEEAWEAGQRGAMTAAAVSGEFAWKCFMLELVALELPARGEVASSRGSCKHEMAR